eukprot:CAMPEP_0172533554 /NCGR_PEP_ID=MMETSP1067-20121228/6217_1 /TAXON_ID=265564 ORGANISM="Thalassiosira punctigera, Strain Tpunct2005C2" /NCGR_SAMPLE_ID=MMETSP1067 /ASSEMBLY_ACC=CAM_ASM_000444 /LENGTH=395 /DNA_ID=CAMNT_0013318207 /DNA_START=14 /DNA_END=1201 /DNA_ORIENTATION=+
MAIARWLSSPGVSAFINACAIFFLCANLIQNYALFHERAVGQHDAIIAPSDHLPPPVSAESSREQSLDSGISLDAISPISLTIPRGKAVALPSIQISKDEEKGIERGQYGGKGDKPHLGGFTEFDPLGVSPTLWKHLITHLGIKSLLDVGCGRGISTAWFVTHGLEYVQCVEGSHDAVLQSIVPNAEERVVEHDFSRGPWWPDRTVDAAWAVEFTEHVGRNYQPNYLTAFRKAALVFVTHSNWGGWHHVEVHDDDWWRIRWEAAGFVYSDYLTKSVRAQALQDQDRKDLTLDMKEDYLYFVGQHIYLNAQVFINPMVASLPAHAHLFAENGCFGGKSPETKQRIHVACTDVHAKGEILTPLPDSFKPLVLNDDMDKQWFELIKEFKTTGRPKKKV